VGIFASAPRYGASYFGATIPFSMGVPSPPRGSYASLAPLTTKNISARLSPAGIVSVKS
jgi:hypothetical protein